MADRASSDPTANRRELIRIFSVLQAASAQRGNNVPADGTSRAMRAINRVIGASSDSKIEGFLDAKAEGSSMSYKDIVRMNDNSGGAYAGDGPATRWSAEEIDRG